MPKSFAFVLLFLISFLPDLFAANVRLYGEVENAENYTLRLKSFKDFVSHQDTIIASHLISLDGKFDFNIEINAPLLLTLKLGFQSASFYVEPDKEYQLKITYDPEKERISFLDKNPLFIDFIDLPKSDLNNLIARFNRHADEFLVKNFSRVYRSKQLYLLDSLRTQTFYLSPDRSKYFEQLVMFRIADIELSAQSGNTEKIFFKYLGNKPIQYNNYEYMVFFNTFFHKYIQTKTKVINAGQLKEIVNNQENIQALSDVLKRDLLLTDDRLRELLILRELYYFFYDFEFRPVKVLNHIRNLNNNSAYPEHRLIAKNLIERITQLQPGSKIYPFSFSDLSGTSMNNKDLEGKYLLLNFWELDCNDCFKNIDSLEYLQNKYADKLNVVAVSGNKYQSNIKSLSEEKNYSMKFVLADPDNLIYDDLKIRSLPSAILLNEKGEIVLYPAILPGRGFKNTFKAVFKE